MRTRESGCDGLGHGSWARQEDRPTLPAARRDAGRRLRRRRHRFTGATGAGRRRFAGDPVGGAQGASLAGRPAGGKDRQDGAAHRRTPGRHSRLIVQTAYQLGGRIVVDPVGASVARQGCKSPRLRSGGDARREGGAEWRGELLR